MGSRSFARFFNRSVEESVPIVRTYGFLGGKKGSSDFLRFKSRHRKSLKSLGLAPILISDGGSRSHRLTRTTIGSRSKEENRVLTG